MKIAIASGKGGTGKTFVSTNLFYSLLMKDESVVLVDCDAEAPNAAAFFDLKAGTTTEVYQQVPVVDTNKCTFCSKCHDYCNYNAIFILPPVKYIQVITDLCHGCGACSVACKFDAITEIPVSMGFVNRFVANDKAQLLEAKTNIGVLSPVRVIKAAIKEVDDYSGTVLFDSPPGTSCPFIQTVEAADFVVLVTEPTPFGLSDLKQSVETLKTMGKICGVIVNRAGLGDSAVYEYLKQENIPLLMEIPYDRNIASFYSKGKLIAEHEKEWALRFVSMFNSIIENYGDSRNQR